MIKAFTAVNWKKMITFMPIEDSFGVDQNKGIFAVADGVTRDSYEFLPDIKTLKGKIKFSLGYPRPSPARIAADIFVEAFPLVLRDYSPSNRDETAIRKAFDEANKRIRRWNARNMPNSDYVTRDLAGCVASAAVLDGDCVHLGFLTDCGVAIFDEEGDLRFRTENEGPDKHDKYIWSDSRLASLKEQGGGWRNPEARRIIREEYRNSPSKEHSFGVLTGEPSAMDYVRTFTKELKPSEHLFIYTDGLEEAIFSSDFADELRNGDLDEMERVCMSNVKTEGTLIYHSRSLGSSGTRSVRDREWQMDQLERDNSLLMD